MAFAEFTPIATIIYQTSNIFSNQVKGQIRSTDNGDDFIDWRGTKISPGVSPSSHSSLADLSSDDHHQYALLSGRVGDILEPINDTDAANKKYVDDSINSLTYSSNDINLTALSGSTGIYLATPTPIQNSPITRVKVQVNSIEVNVGNGTTTSDCYFSNDNGITAKTHENISQGDQLYWNSTVAPYNLENTDEIDFIYFYFILK